MSELETYLGVMYDYSSPQEDQIEWEDVFLSLSQIARFGGHTNRPYSVGEHVLLVSRLVAGKGGTAAQLLAALHHDTHEVYLGDWPTPLKREIESLAPGVYDALRAPADAVILDKLGLPWGAFDDPIIRYADQIALRIEAADLKFTHGLTPYWGYTELPREILDHRIDPIEPSHESVRDALRNEHDVLSSSVTR